MATDAELQAIYGGDYQNFLPPPDVPPPNAPAPPSSGPDAAPATPAQLQAIYGTAPVTPAPNTGTIGPVPAAAAPDDGGFLSRSWHAVKAFATGDDDVEHPDIGALNLAGLGAGVSDAAPIIAGMATTRDPQAMVNILKGQFPDANFSQDAKGNPIVQRGNGPPMYVMRPGLTPDKALYYGVQALPAVATAGATSALPFALRTALTAGEAGAQSIGSDLGAMAAGSGGGIELGRAGGAAAGAIAGQVAAPVLGAAATYATRAVAPVWRAAYGLGGRLFNDAAAAAAPDAAVTPGMLTTTGQTVFDKANIDPTKFTVGQALAIQDAAGTQAGDAATAATAASSQTAKEFNIPVTRGQATGDPTQLLREDALTNAGTPSAQRTMTRFFTGQTNAVNQAKQDLVGAPVDEEQLGTSLINAVRAHTGQLDSAEDAAWQPFNDLSPDSASGRAVQFSPTVSANLAANVAQTGANNFGLPNAVTGEIDPSARSLYPGALLAASRLNNLATDAQADGSRAIGGFNLGELQQTRQNINNIYRAAAPGSQDQRVVGQFKLHLDDAINDAVTNGDVTGPPGTLDQLNAARAATRAKYAFTQPNNNPAAQAFIGAANNTDAPITGQAALDRVLGQGGGAAAPRCSRRATPDQQHRRRCRRSAASRADQAGAVWPGRHGGQPGDGHASKPSKTSTRRSTGQARR